MIDKDEIADLIVFYRRKKKLTQEKMGELLGIKRSWVCLLEKGRTPSAPVIFKLQKLLDELVKKNVNN